MIYGDRAFEEDEIKYPDITASLQAGNLYGYCMGNPVRYSDNYGLYVYMVGADVAAEAGIAIDANAGLVFDDHGNVGVFAFGNAGAGFLGVGISGFKGVYDLDNINQIKDTALTINVSGGSGVSVTYSTILDENGKIVGTTLGVGPEINLPLVPASASVYCFSIGDVTKLFGTGNKGLGIIKFLTGV